MNDLTLIGFGSLVGFALGVTGSGGSILAIPLLVYGVGLPLHTALLISLLIVASIAFVGAVRQTMSGDVQWRTAFLFSLTGMIVSPLVLKTAHLVSEKVHLVLFAFLMLFVSANMAFPLIKTLPLEKQSLQPKSPVRIGLAGATIGALSGFFGVGSGFMIVPFLTLVFSIPYRQAVGTSLAVIALISSSAVIGGGSNAYPLDWHLFLTFFAGGVLGVMFASFVIKKIPEKKAKRFFAVFITILALLMLYEKIFWDK